IKQCHTYLLSELLAAKTREGRYGGSFENRTRFVRNVIGKIKNELGDKLMLATRINVYDGLPYRKNEATNIGVPRPYPIPYPYAFGVNEMDPLQVDLTEPMMLVKLLRDLGVKMVNISMGSPYFNPHIIRPFERPPIDGYESPEHPLIGVDRHFRATGEIQRAFPDLVIVGTGYTWLRQYLLYAAEANARDKKVSIAAVGRGAIAYPDYAKDGLTAGKLDPKKVCLTVSFCTALMRAKNNELGQFPTGCVPRDKVYVPIYGESKRSLCE
ncbi:MAG: NADH:flavin oxidoreductase, partial [Candidatus Poribacteria bacterium]